MLAEDKECGVVATRVDLSRLGLRRGGSDHLEPVDQFEVDRERVPEGFERPRPILPRRDVIHALHQDQTLWSSDATAFEETGIDDELKTSRVFWRGVHPERAMHILDGGGLTTADRDIRWIEGDDVREVVREWMHVTEIEG